jgi:hypothetical protein
MVKVFDINGQQQDWDWLVANYGDIQIQKPNADSYFKVTELREKYGDSAFVVKVLREDGTPKTGKTVLFYWPDAPDAPGSGWLEQGVGGTTNENGDVGFGMGPGAYYTPPAGGPHKSWLFGENVSEMVEGIGMIAATDHHHIDVTFQWVEGEEPEPEPEDDDLTRLADAAERIAAALEKVAGVFA